MSEEAQIESVAANVDEVAKTTTESNPEQERAAKIVKAKELYSNGSRNFLVKSYTEAADELSQVCTLYEELYGELSDELGMPYLLYAKSLIALALDENKVIDVPDIDNDDDDDEDEDEEAEGAEEAEAASSSTSKAATANGSAEKMDSIAEEENDCDEADSSGDVATTPATVVAATKKPDDSDVTSTEECKDVQQNGGGDAATVGDDDDEKPSTSHGEAGATNGDSLDVEEEDNEAASSLQLAWEILELAAKIFSRQGLSGLPNLAEVQTELANIEFENNILDAAREDYGKALKIYEELPKNYRRAKAEIHYKIGLTFLMQQLNKEGATSLREACALIKDEMETIREKADQTEKDKSTIQDLEETLEEIWVKITEIEEMQAQTMAEVRAALDSYIKPMSSCALNDDAAGPSSSSLASSSSSSKATTAKLRATNGNGAATSSSSSAASSSIIASTSGSSPPAISSSSKPTDISHLIKRKKPDEPNSEAEAAVCSPAKRAAV